MLGGWEVKRKIARSWSGTNDPLRHAHACACRAGASRFLLVCHHAGRVSVECVARTGPCRGRERDSIESERSAKLRIQFHFVMARPGLPDLGHSPRLRGLLPGGRAFLLGGLLPLGVGRFRSEAARSAPSRRPGVPLRRQRTHVRRPLPLGVAFGGCRSSLASSCSEAARRAPSQRRSVPRRRRAPV